MIKTGVRPNLHRSKEQPRGEEMAAEARRKCLLHQVHLTLATRVWAGPKPITSSTLPEWSQNKAAFGFTTPPPSPQHHIPPAPARHTPQFACIIKVNPILYRSRSDPLKWPPGPEHKLALAFLAVSAWTVCHLTNLVPLSMAPEGSRSAIFKDSVHKIMNKGLT